MSRCMILAAATLGMALISGPALAQAMGPPPAASGSPSPATAGPGRNMMSQDQFNKLQDYADRAKRLTKEDKAKGKTVEDLAAEDKANAEALAKAMPLSCEVADAFMAAKGPATVDGKTVETETYEAACANGMGYFLISQKPAAPNGFSCFAADAARLADIAAGKAPGTFCRLPGNADMKTLATAVLAKAGVTCTATATRWIGQNAAAKTEFDEVACADGKGYILKTALPGSLAPPAAIGCYDADMQGLPCRLTKSGAVTLETLKNELAKNGVSCEARDLHVLGQETSTMKRYVVELACPQYPKPRVAFIPPAGSSATFEMMDCATAAKRGLKCSAK